MSFARNVPTAVVDLDKPRTIALTLDALGRLEETLGQSVMGISLDADQIVKKLDAWVWSAMDDVDREELSQSDVRRMIHMGNLASIASAVTNLITASLPDPPEGKQVPAPPRVRRAVAGRS